MKTCLSARKRPGSEPGEGGGEGGGGCYDGFSTIGFRVRGKKENIGIQT